MEWEWRVVSLKDMFPGGLQALRVSQKGVGPEEVFGGWRDAVATAETPADRSRRHDGGGGGKETANLLGCVALKGMERVPPEAGTQGSGMSLWTLRPCRGDRGPSVLADVRREKTSSTPMLSRPTPSAGTSSIRRIQITAQRTGAVASMLGKRKAARPPTLVVAAARAAASRRVGSGSVGSGAPAMR